MADKRKQEKACTVALVTKKEREDTRARNTLSIVDLANRVGRKSDENGGGSRFKTRSYVDLTLVPSLN